MRFVRVLLLLLVIALAASAQSAPSFDILIVNGHTIDGTGSPWYSGDIGIRDAKVAAIGNLSGASAQRTIDAKGRVVALRIRGLMAPFPAFCANMSGTRNS